MATGRRKTSRRVCHDRNGPLTSQLCPRNLRSHAGPGVTAGRD
jgi:hypothetical protein